LLVLPDTVPLFAGARCSPEVVFKMFLSDVAAMLLYVSFVQGTTNETWNRSGTSAVSTNPSGRGDSGNVGLVYLLLPLLAFLGPYLLARACGKSLPLRGAFSVNKDGCFARALRFFQRKYINTFLYVKLENITNDLLVLVYWQANKWVIYANFGRLCFKLSYFH